MTKERYLHSFIVEDLSEKMVFVAGPRQVGKTTLAKLIAKKDYPESQYLNWDNREDRKYILAEKFNAESKLIIFDEIHKYKSWKNMLKGIFDKHHERFAMLVTGSARLDLYRKGGDSMLGRYFNYRLHPFSLHELAKLPHKIITPFQELIFSSISSNMQRLFSVLFKFGGFPEPLIKQEERTLRRWHNERLDRLVKEDIRDATLLRDISSLQILTELLPKKVGSLLSLNSLREDLQITHKTITLWMEVLEEFYYHFRIYPYSASTIKSLRKEPKLYLWDWSKLEDEGARLENMIASHLLKFCHFLYDTQGYKIDLHYLRDIDGREVDFLITINKKPWFAVEVKLNDDEPSKHLNYFGKRLKIPFSYQVIKKSGINIIKDNIQIMSADIFLSGLI